MTQKKWRKANPEKHRAQAKRYRIRHPERKAAQNRSWALAHPQEIKDKHAKWRSKNPDKVLNNYLKTRFKISLEKYNEILSIQEGVCAICNGHEKQLSPKGFPKRLSVDHCHKTGKIRGLLCDRCNTSLGRLEENVELIQSLANYILLHQEGG